MFFAILCTIIVELSKKKSAKVDHGSLARGGPMLFELRELWELRELRELWELWVRDRVGVMIIMRQSHRIRVRGGVLTASEPKLHRATPGHPI